MLVACAILAPWLGACSHADRIAATPSAAANAPPNSPPSSSAHHPERVVAASATAADMVCSLIGPERVAGVPDQALDYSILHAGDPRWRSTPHFAVYQAESVLALHPDLVVACSYQSHDTSERLEESGVHVVKLREVESYDDARRALLELAPELDADDAARELVAKLDRRVAALRANSGARRGVRALCYSNFGAQGWSAGSKTTIDEMMKLAGLTNIVAEKGGEGHRTMTFEELIVLDPDLILVGEPLTETASGSAGDRGGASESILLSEASLKNLRAVREKRIVALPAWLFATDSQELVTGAEVLAERVDRALSTLRGAPEAKR